MSIKIHTIKKCIQRNYIVTLGFSAGVLFWFFESFVHSLIFREGTIIQQIFSPSLHEIWTRSGACCFIIFTGYVIQFFVNKRKQIEEELQKMNDELDKRVSERTSDLITTNKKLKQSVHENKQLKQQIEFILGVTKTGLDIIDGEFNILYIDSEWQKIYGDPTGKKCFAYFMDRTLPCPDCGVIKALESKEIIVSEEYLVKEHRPIQVTTIPFQNEKGEWLVAEINVDITDRKRAEEDLRASENKFRELFENMANGVAIYEVENNGEDFIFKNFNQAAEIIEQRIRSEVIGKNVIEVFPQAEKGFIQVFRKVWETGEPEFNTNFVYSEEGKIKMARSFYTYKLPSGEIVAIYDDITARKQSEQELLESESRLAKAQEIAHLGSWILDLSTNTVSFSGEMHHILDFNPQEDNIHIETLIERIHPDDRDQFKEDLKITQYNEIPYNSDFRIIRPTGEVRFIHGIGQLEKDSHGKVLRIRSTAQDITDRKKTEEALRLKNFVFDLSIAAISTADTQGILNEVNNSFLKIWRYSRKDEVIGKAITEFFEKEEEAMAVLTGLNNSGTWEGEFIAKKKDGSVFIAYGLATVLRDTTNTLIGYQSSVIDITSRKRMEDVLRKSERELLVRNRINNIFLTVSDNETYGEVIKLILEATESKHGLFGHIDHNGDLFFPSISKNVWDQCTISIKDILFAKEEWNDFFRSVLIEKKSNCNNKPFQVPTGHIPISRALTIPIVHNGKTIGIIIVANKPTDYTEEDENLLQIIVSHIAPILFSILGKKTQEMERIKGEVERRKLEQDLLRAQKLESIGTLAAGIAHEINTPIQFIGNNTNFIAKNSKRLFDLIRKYKELFSSCEADEKQKNIINKAKELDESSALSFLEEEIPLALTQTKEGIDHVTRIVSAMKDFSHVNSAEKKPDDLNKAITSTVTISRNEWKYVADLKTDLDPSLPLVECFIGDIKQVILNLIVNAAHTIKDALGEKEGEKGLITITTGQKDDSAVISVSDTGMGIPEEIRDKVFDHFFTTKEVGKGTGQGLSMAYSTIIEKHGGKLTFDTEVGKGTTFYINLPMQDKKEVRV